MKNNGTLPLAAPSSLTLFGRTAADPIYGGSSSGAVNLDTVIDLKTGLERAGYRINVTAYEALARYAAYTVESGVLGATRNYTNPRANIAMDNPSASSYYIREMPLTDYTDTVQSSFANYNDAAIVVIGRGGGEGGDLATDMNGWDENYMPGQNQL